MAPSVPLSRSHLSAHQLSEEHTATLFYERSFVKIVSLICASSLFCSLRIRNDWVVAQDDELALMTTAARQYYLEGKTRVEIATQLRTSRFKVARLLEAARKLGVVTITIRPHGLVDSELSEQLKQRFGLSHALVVWADGEDPEELYGQLGRAAARHLAKTVSAKDVLGFDTGRTVSHIADHLDSLPPCDVVQLSGLAGTVQLNGLEILRRVIEVNGGTAYPLYAPMIALDAAAAAAYRQQPEVRTTKERYRHLTTAIVSVGSWDPPVSQVYDRLSEIERQTLLQAGVTAETCALMFDRDGGPVHALDDRRIGIPLTDLMAVPNVIAVAGGQDKATAIHALLKSGILNTMVTDVGTAERLVGEDGLAA
jgi:DNA-binding transcriptional regulator LsrR (DeoR family)